jgi:hypothetical protein
MATHEEFMRWAEAEEAAIRAYDEAISLAHRAMRDPSLRLPGEGRGNAYRRIAEAAVAALDESKTNNPYPA